MFYTLADGFAAACRSACMHRLPAVPGTQFMYDFLVSKSYFHGRLRSATLYKTQSQPQVTHSIPPIYCFQRYELTYIAAEVFLTDCSTPISMEIIVSHHTRAIITRGLYFFTSFFTAVYIQERFILQIGWYYKETFLSLDFF